MDDGTHACSYLLATDMDMEPVPGYKFASWEAGYGDIHLVPDMKTLRVASWCLTHSNFYGLVILFFLCMWLISM